MDVQSELAPLACLHIQKVHFQWQSIYTMIIPTPFAEAVRLYTWEQVAHKIKRECLPPPQLYELIQREMLVISYIVISYSNCNHLLTVPVGKFTFRFTREITQEH